MADLSITAASVAKSTSGSAADGIAGETITAGQTLWYDSSVSKYKKADADHATSTDPGPQYPTHVALNGGGDGQPIKVLALDPELTLGATAAVAGDVIVQSDTAGAMCPVADLAAGSRVTVLGVMKTATVMKFAPISGGVVPA